MTTTPPSLSTIIASVNGQPMIEDCLASLEHQRENPDSEVIVVDVLGEETASLVREKFPWVKLLSFDERLSIPELRAIGLDHSSGDIVAIIEDHCVMEEHWCERIVEAHRLHPECIAVGGAVENGSPERLVDWAVFFCEYSYYMLPLPRGVVAGIPGNNVSYKRRAFEGLDDPEETLKQGFWETTLHGKLQAIGEKFLLEPDILVYHKKYFGIRYFISQRYHYSRYYAGMIHGRASLPKRVFRGVASLAIPPLIIGRIVSHVVHKRRHLGKLILAAPLLALFTTVWAVGESAGCLLGPGQSLRKIE